MSPPAGGQLLVAEQLMLLAFSPGDGRLHSAVRHNLPMGVAGAALAELAIHRTIGIDPRGGHAEKHRVLAMGPGTGDPLLDSTAAQIQAQPPRTLAWWIKGLSRSGVQGRVASRLLARGLAVTSRGVFPATCSSHSLPRAPTRQPGCSRRLLCGPPVTAGLWVSDPCSAALTSLAVGCRVVEASAGFLVRSARQRR